ncbi:MAG: hypothetical protein II453_19280 [Alphaproteobacteria bacterium]|nr:hypothetical protein [Alphaproteobacteria bacterium]MBQ3946557.1 hypothetical protein [Alphaproteobacteria bacterium]
MTNKEAYKLIGERARELTRKPEIQSTMLHLAKEKGEEEATKWLYMAAIATLVGGIANE